MRVPAPMHVGGITLRFGQRPYLMGILNVTPDSFSDGGSFHDHGRAIDHALAMAEAGADLLDIGGESTRPGAAPVPAGEEIERVLPVIDKIVQWTAVPVSIDTTKAEVAAAALDAGAAMVNDVSALRFDPDMAGLVASRSVPLCLMHMRGEPRTMQSGPIVYDDLMGTIRDFLAGAVRRAVAAGVREDLIVVDPGIGFGKTPVHNLMILNRIGSLCELGRPVLVGPSRKAFIGAVTGRKVGARLHGTAAAVAMAVAGGAHILRVHDVGPMRDVIRVVEAVRSERLPAATPFGAEKPS